MTLNYTVYIWKEAMFTEIIDRVSVRGGTHLVTSQEMAAFDVPLPPRLPSCNECDGGTSAAGHSTWRHIEPDYLCGKTKQQQQPSEQSTVTLVCESATYKVTQSHFKKSQRHQEDQTTTKIGFLKGKWRISRCHQKTPWNTHKKTFLSEMYRWLLIDLRAFLATLRFSWWNWSNFETQRVVGREAIITKFMMHESSLKSRGRVFISSNEDIRMWCKN